MVKKPVKNFGFGKYVNTVTFAENQGYPKYCKKAKTLFKKFKKNISKAEAKIFLDGLVADSVTYKNIFDTETKKWSRNEMSLKNSFSILYGFNVTQQTPMVLSIMREYNAKRLKYKVFKSKS